MTEAFAVATTAIELPTIGGEPGSATLAYLAKSPPNTLPPTPFGFLHAVRSGSLARIGSGAWAHSAWSYYRDLSKVLRVVEHWSQSQAFDLGVLAPSSRRDGEPYLAAIMSRQATWIDLSPYFTKQPQFRSGSAGTLSETIDAITCTVRTVPDTVQHLLIVDDVYAQGFTAGAVVHYLRSVGLSTRARITIFAPVWMPKS